jgi:serine/alanine adding enzyme
MSVKPAPLEPSLRADSRRGDLGAARGSAGAELVSASASAAREATLGVGEPPSSELWQDYVAQAAGASLYHDYRWRSVFERVLGCRCHYLTARDADGVVRGVLPLARLKSVVFGDFLVSLPYVNYGGVLADTPAARVALVTAAEQLAAALGVQHVEYRHSAALDLTLPLRTDKVAMLLDLPPSSEVLWERLGGKLRAQIRRPEKAGATARSGSKELLSAFYEVFARNMRDLGTPVYPRRFFAAILEAFPAEARLHIVDLGGRPVAAGLVLAHRGVAEIPWASSLREANRDSVNMLLYWSVLREAVAQGCTRFDFGRSSKDSGTFRFKAQWGAQAQQLYWHYWLAPGQALPMLTPGNPKYRLAIALWRKLPLPVANLLGPHIVKHLP